MRRKRRGSGGTKEAVFWQQMLCNFTSAALVLETGTFRKRVVTSLTTSYTICRYQRLHCTDDYGVASQEPHYYHC